MSAPQRVLVFELDGQRYGLPFERVDSVSVLASYESRDLSPVADFAPGTGAIAGVVRLADGLVLIQDLDRFLSLDEERGLEEAMANRAYGLQDEEYLRLKILTCMLPAL